MLRMYALAAALVAASPLAHAGPCTTGSTALDGKTNDAGSGPTPGAAAKLPSAAQTPAAPRNANPEASGTALMNEAVGDKATSSQDVQKQIQGQPTAAQQSAGAKPDC